MQNLTDLITIEMLWAVAVNPTKLEKEINGPLSLSANLIISIPSLNALVN